MASTFSSLPQFEDGGEGLGLAAVPLAALVERRHERSLPVTARGRCRLLSAHRLSRVRRARRPSAHPIDGGRSPRSGRCWSKVEREKHTKPSGSRTTDIPPGDISCRLTVRDLAGVATFKARRQGASLRRRVELRYCYRPAARREIGAGASARGSRPRFMLPSKSRRPL